MYPWRTGRSCLFKNTIHLVFVTKYRKNVFDNLMLDRLKQLIAETCIQLSSELIEFGGEDDHVHLLVNVNPKISISNLVGKLKGKSSYFLRLEFTAQLSNKLWGNHLWSPSYCVVSTGGASIEIVKEYIKKQRIEPTPNQITRAIIASKR